MDVVAAASGYISKMVTVGESAGASSSKMKILLLDSETVGDFTLLAIYRSRSLTPIVIGPYCFDRHYPIRPSQS